MISDIARSVAARLERVGSTSADHLAAQRDALAAIRDVIGFDVGTFATVDPATVLWTSCVLHGLDEDPSREAFMFENEYLQDDLLKIADLARNSQPAGRLSAFNSETRSRSTRYQLLRSFGAVDELRCAIVDRDHCWGSFEIYRSEASGSFSDDDVETAVLLSRPLARLIRIALLHQAASIPAAIDEPPGVVVLDAHGNPEAMSPACPAWFEEIAAEPSIPAVIRSLAIRVAGEGENAASIVTPRRSGGWLRIHAVPLSAGEKRTVSVIVEPSRVPALPETVANVYGFTPREREVIMCLARGLSTKEIGGQLDISPLTVNDHIKSAFGKAGVQSRQQLVASLFFNHCLPLRELEAVPGPYGWFLDNDRATRTISA